MLKGVKKPQIVITLTISKAASFINMFVSNILIII